MNYCVPKCYKGIESGKFFERIWLLLNVAMVPQRLSQVTVNSQQIIQISRSEESLQWLVSFTPYDFMQGEIKPTWGECTWDEVQNTHKVISHQCDYVIIHIILSFSEFADIWFYLAWVKCKIIFCISHGKKFPKTPTKNLL